jgi:speckle-type POZ protein
MTDIFKWIRPGYELVKVKLEWNIRVPHLGTVDENEDEFLVSQETASELTPYSYWKLLLIGDGQHLKIRAKHLDFEGITANIVNPVIVKFAIVNGKGQKVLEQLVSSQPKESWVQILLPKNKINGSYSTYLQSDGSLTLYCKIFSHVRIKDSPMNPKEIETICTQQLVIQLTGLFESMQLSDVKFWIGDREFPAHKVILVTRSKVFASMFEYETKENLTNQIEIEDIEPQVFQELLRFIYTGQVPLYMGTIAAALLIAADKYLLDGLKMICENYLLRYISPENCVVLLLNGDLENPTERLKEAAKYFLRYPTQVMATANWKTTKEEDPTLLCNIQEFVFSCK